MRLSQQRPASTRSRRRSAACNAAREDRTLLRAADPLELGELELEEEQLEEEQLERDGGEIPPAASPPRFPKRGRGDRPSRWVLLLGVLGSVLALAVCFRLWRFILELEQEQRRGAT